MREIKFRGKCLDNGEWIYGSLIFIDGRKPHIFSNHGAVEVNPATVGQYTGLKDKSGKEIWEGDVVNVFFGSDPVPMQVLFELGGWKVEDQYGDEAHDLDYYAGCDEVEILGNMHDNPELLTQ